MVVSYHNATTDYEVTYITFEPRVPPEEYFAVPEICDRRDVYKGPKVLTATGVPLSTIADFRIKFQGPNIAKGNYTETVHPIVKETLKRKFGI